MTETGTLSPGLAYNLRDFIWIEVFFMLWIMLVAVCERCTIDISRTTRHMRCRVYTTKLKPLWAINNLNGEHSTKLCNPQFSLARIDERKIAQCVANWCCTWAARYIRMASDFMTRSTHTSSGNDNRQNSICTCVIKRWFWACGACLPRWCDDAKRAQIILLLFVCGEMTTLPSCTIYGIGMTDSSLRTSQVAGWPPLTSFIFLLRRFSF